MTFAEKTYVLKQRPL